MLGTRLRELISPHLRSRPPSSARYGPNSQESASLAKSNYQKVKEWRAKFPEKRAAQSRRYAARHPETHARAHEKYRVRHRETLLPKEAAQARARRKADPEGNRRRMAAFKARQIAKMIAVAGRPPPEVCELCGEPPNDWSHQSLVFDHCHASGKFRGWLCDRCNRTLGQVKDSIELLHRMIRYLSGDPPCLAFRKATHTLATPPRTTPTTLAPTYAVQRITSSTQPIPRTG